MLLKSHVVCWRDEGHCQRQHCAEHETGGRREGSLSSMDISNMAHDFSWWRFLPIQMIQLTFLMNTQVMAFAAVMPEPYDLIR